MRENAPVISVVMPVFNTERYVAQAVESILGQSFKDFEFIIIDDGSTDGSLAILQRYANADRRIRLVSRANTGYTAALNEGLGMARGEFVARMDSDDVSKPERFERQVAFLEGHPEVVVVGSQVRVIDPDGDVIGPIADRPLDHEAIDAGQIGGGGTMIHHPAVLMRRAALTRVGGYRVEFETAEDFDLWLRLAEVGRLANLKEVLVDYRFHLRSVSRTRTLEQGRMAIRATAEARARRGLAPLAPREIGTSNPSEADMLRSWVRNSYWWGNYRTARKHALRAVRLEPGSLYSWRLFVGAHLGAIGRPLYRLLGGEH